MFVDDGDWAYELFELCVNVMTALDIRTVAREMPAVGDRLQQAIEQRTASVVGAPS